MENMDTTPPSKPLVLEGSPSRACLAKPKTKRKRRRSLPPLSVSSVFTPARLPENSHELWEWPVTSWYLGEVGESDVKLAAERPFVDHVALATEHTGKVLPKHYRLRWLEEDAKELVGAKREIAPDVSEERGSSAFGGRKDSTACARPMQGVKRILEDAKKGKKGTQRVSKRLCTSSSGRDKGKSCSIKRASTSKAPVTEIPGVDVNPKNVSVSNANPPVPWTGKNQMDDAPLAIGKHAETLNGCTGGDSACVIPAKGIGLAGVAFNLHKSEHIPLSPEPSANVSSPIEADQCQPLVKTEASQQELASSKDEPTIVVEVREGGTKMDDKSTANDLVSFVQSQQNFRDVCLQFQSPHEPRLMGSLTYSVPRIADQGLADQLNNVGDDCVPKHGMANIGTGTLVHNVDLEFRKADSNFATDFEDRDIADELGPEIQKRSTMLLGLEDEARPLRSIMLDALQAEFEKQKDFADLLNEETRIVARLKEIEHQKKEAKRTAKETAKEFATASRRTSERRRSTSRARSVESRDGGSEQLRSRARRTSQPARKILKDTDEENESDEEEQSQRALHEAESMPLVTSPPADIAPKESILDNNERPCADTETPSLETSLFSANLVVPQTGKTSNPRAESEAGTEAGPSTAPSPSDDGAGVGGSESPYGVFLGESGDNIRLARVSSPVSPLLAAAAGRQTVVFPQVKGATDFAASIRIVKSGAGIDKMGDVGNKNSGDD